MAEVAPATVSYARIVDEILAPASIGLPPSDPFSYIRKLKLSADRALFQASGVHGVIQNVRGTGYRLAADWRSHGVKLRGEHLVIRAQLEALTSRCIQLMGDAPLMPIEVGSPILRIDKSSLGSDASNLLNEFDSFMVLALNQLKDGGDAPAAIADLRSYYSFDRVGLVEEGAWRLLFRSELLTKVARVWRTYE